MTLLSNSLNKNFHEYTVIDTWFLSIINPISYVMILRDDKANKRELEHILLKMTEGDEDLTILHVGLYDACLNIVKRSYNLKSFMLHKDLVDITTVDDTHQRFLDVNTGNIISKKRSGI